MTVRANIFEKGKVVGAKYFHLTFFSISIAEVIGQRSKVTKWTNLDIGPFWGSLSLALVRPSLSPFRIILFFSTVYSAFFRRAFIVFRFSQR